jgi:hypothetical protein
MGYTKLRMKRICGKIRIYLIPRSERNLKRENRRIEIEITQIHNKHKTK